MGREGDGGAVVGLWGTVFEGGGWGRKRRAGGDGGEDVRVRRLEVELDAPDEGEGVWEEGEQMREEGFAGGGVGVDFWPGRGDGCRHCEWVEREKRERLTDEENRRWQGKVPISFALQ